MLVLDIGCGTGDDAIHLARRGVHVIACDFSPGMLNRADEKIKLAGFGRDIELRELRIENLVRLIEELPMGFDGVYSNFGPLNLVENLTEFAALNARLLNPDCKSLHVVMNSHPIFEMFYFLLHGRTERAFSRCKGYARVMVGGTPIKCMFYSPKELSRYFQRYFTVDRIEALGLLLPPPYLSGHFRRRRKFYKRLIPFDRFISGLGFFNSLGDHFIIEMTRNDYIIHSAA
jgi:ubiquinone/menaquinone biosynthesis C-methylase UbiE